MEHSHFQFGKKDIRFEIYRSKKRKKTVSVIVDPEEGVSLLAPAHVDRSTLEAIALDKGAWIVQKLKSHQESRYDVAEREFITGESIQYLGRNYILKIETDPLLRNGGFCRLKGKYLECYVSDRKNEALSLRAIKAWYYDRAAEKLSERVAFYAKTMSLQYGAIMIREQKKRWASCDRKGNLRFNWQIIMAPLKMVDYVVVHELAHIKVHNHSPAFWNKVKSALPDYQNRKEKLRKLGMQFSFIKKLDEVDLAT
jgi:predicted metal-dependent hydrolase